MTKARPSVLRMGLYGLTALWYLFVVLFVTKPFSPGVALESKFAVGLIGMATLHVVAFSLHEWMLTSATRRFSVLVSVLIACASTWGLLYGVRFASWGEHFGWGGSALVAIIDAMSLRRSGPGLRR